ncbi:MFS transporter [Castellaniella caeni]|uniref:MFS transporter n=1 Tax=Castellaniella caeni TaxID=266123 RepID=UPI000B15E01F|nr:MFS transporter [Castellaniella caeni]
MADAGKQASGSALNPGVRRREVWSWAMYDFANSSYTTVVLTTVFNAYFVGVVAAGRAWGTLALTAALSLSYLVVMLAMPWLGARADARAGHRRLLFSSTVGCVLATAALASVGPGVIAWGLLCLALSNAFYCVGESTVASFLPGLARPEAMGRVSGWGWSFGYCGGMLALGLSLWLVSTAESQGLDAARYVPRVMLFTALFFALAAVPSFLWLREPTGVPTAQPAPRALWAQLRHAWRETRQDFPDFRRLLMCIASYQAGITVVITLSAVYATEVMGFGMRETMLLVFLVNIGAAAGAFGFGYLQDRIGHKRALALTLLGWVLMVLLAAFARSLAVFWSAAALAGLCMGTSQSAGRAMVGVLAPAHRPAEFFALWTFAVQLAAVVGPLTYGALVWLTRGDHRLALLATGLFFVLGLVLLARLDFVRGQRARERHVAAAPMSSGGV